MDINSINPIATGKIEQKVGSSEQKSGAGFKERLKILLMT